MSATITIDVNIDSELKDQTGRILSDMGLNFNQAFIMMLHQVRLQKTLPFDTSSSWYTPTEETIALIDSIENGTAEMAGPFTYDEYKAWLDEVDDDDEV